MVGEILKLFGKGGLRELRHKRIDRKKVEKKLKYIAETTERIRKSTWHMGEDVNFAPTKPELFSLDAVETKVLKGWMPETPGITRDTNIVAFGSCFAQHIADWLKSRDYTMLTGKGQGNDDVHVVSYAEGMVNTFVLRQQFEWAFENIKPQPGLWHQYDSKPVDAFEETRQKTLALFEQADVFIVTLGLSEVWSDVETGGVFWRAVPKRKFDPAKHQFRVSTVSENKENIRAMIDIIAKHRPDAKVIFTVSPIPLGATFRPVSSMTANSVSKAILRAALDEVLRELDADAKVHYWPSFEIVNDVFADVWTMDRRHVSPAVLDFIMTLFEDNWCADSAPEVSSGERYVKALIATKSLPQALRYAYENMDLKALSELIDDQVDEGRTDVARFIVDAAETISERRGGRRTQKVEDWAEEWRATLTEREAKAPST